MSYADQIFVQNCKDILAHGVWDTDCPVRPKWDDGSPAHTIKLFGVINRYDLRKEFPILTVRRTYWKTAVDELLWIWQKKSNLWKDTLQLNSTSRSRWPCDECHCRCRPELGYWKGQWASVFHSNRYAPVPEANHKWDSHHGPEDSGFAPWWSATA